MYEGKEALEFKNTLSAGLSRVYVKTEEKSKEVTNTETGEKELKKLVINLLVTLKTLVSLKTLEKA